MTRRIQGVMQGISESYEIIYVNDSSADTSWEVLKELRAETGESKLSIS